MAVMRIFLFPVLISIVALIGILFGIGLTAFITAVLLVILEVTLSFDNAVVNARVLENMSQVWRRRFLTWGILIAVFGTRVVLPVLIVSVAAWMSPTLVAKLAVSSPEDYAHLLEDAHVIIAAFGGAFLLMVSLKYFFDESKEVHWIEVIEHRLARFGRIESVEIGFAMIALLALSFFASEAEQFAILAAGTVGIGLFIFMQGLTSSFSEGIGDGMAASGLSLFLYLNVLDSAFSLDSVVGAFALSSSIVVIAVGLGVGAYFVRALTVYLVEKKTLDTLVYLEHGAHWAIFGLAGSMLASIFLEVSELITGTIGLAFVAAAYYSSALYRRNR